MTPHETVRFDHVRLQDMAQQLARDQYDAVVCGALDDLSGRMAYVATGLAQDRLAELRRTVAGLITLSEQLGLTTLACVSRDVVHCIDVQDGISLTATYARLVRVGELSVTVLWDMEDARP
ncbi:hypothetical protein [Pseudaestuariivita sp.]|uniref:hypothetical protein n=1 Tax=Pseudaestuariivita sp. TaxID=2211669 RepID=UPI004059A5D8